MTSESSATSVLAGRPVFVIDSWPVLEWLYLHEPVSTHFRDWLEQAERGEIRLLMSRINRGEIIYNAAIKLGRERLEEIKEKVDALPCEVISAEDHFVDEAAELKTLYPISYADCFVAVLARLHNAPVMTGDPDFLKLQSAGVLRVQWMGR